MNEIEKYLDNVCRTLGGSHELREHIREELREHLEEAIETHIAKGISRDEATRKAIEEFGQSEDVGKGLESVYGHRMMALVIDKAMEWKERNMKTGWKWSFVATVALFGVIAAEVALVLCMVVFVFPKIQDTYESILGMDAPGYYVATLHVVRFLFRGASWGILGLFIAAWALFEWRNKSENKPVIRLGAGAVIALAVTIATWWVAFATIVPLAQTSGFIMRQDLRPTAAAATKNAAIAFADLRSSVAAKDWNAATRALGHLNRAINPLRQRPAAAATLVAMRRPQDIERAQQLLDEMAEKAENLFLTINRDPKPEKVSSLAPRDFEELSKSWETFCKEIQCESTDVQIPAAATEQTKTGGNP